MATINIGKVRLSLEGDYDNNRAYVAQEVVLFNGESYACTVDTQAGNNPSNATHWVKIAEKGADSTVPGPQGDTGAQGAQGPIGATGSTGPQGLQGPSGVITTLNDGNIYLGDNTNTGIATNLNTAIEDLNYTKAKAGGYEFTGGFTDRVSGAAGASDIGNDVEYTQAMVDSNAWLRFGFNTTRQTSNDTPYWGNSSNADEAPHAGTTDYIGKGLFSGAYMPDGVTSLFDFDDNDTFNAASTSGTIYNAATGSYDMSQLDVGDFCQFRFDFNLTPQFANTTVEVGLIWATRDANNNVTFTFALTGEPLFYGAGTTGQTFLNRPITTAYLASAEDVNARALPAIRSDQPVFIQPLTSLFVVGR